MEFSGLAWQSGSASFFPHPERGRNYTGPAILCLVLLRHGRALSDTSPARRRHRALPCGTYEFLWLRPGSYSSFQHRSHLARSVVTLVGVHLFSCCRYFSGSDDCWQRTGTSAVAFLCAVVCSCLCRFWEFGRRIRRNSRVDSARVVLVWRSGL